MEERKKKEKGADMKFQNLEGSEENFKDMRVIYGISKTRGQYQEFQKHEEFQEFVNSQLTI